MNLVPLQVGEQVFVEEMGKKGTVTFFDGRNVRVKFRDGPGAPHRFVYEVNVEEIEVSGSARILGIGMFQGKVIRRRATHSFRRG